jgi:L-arabinokinase
VPTVALYVSGHGYGHAVRSAQLAAALLARASNVVVRTDAPAWLFPSGVSYVPGQRVDVGVVQHDGLEFAVDATRQRWADFGATFPQRVEDEANLLRERQVDVLVGDMPPLGFAAAARAGIPSAAVTNFGWDWIYAAWPGMDQAIEFVQSGYRQADLLYRLPLHSTRADAFPAFRAVEDVPLIARFAHRSRQEVRADLGLDQQAHVVLISFGAFQAERLDVAALGCSPEYTFLLTPPISTRVQAAPSNVLLLREQPADYVSLLAACDAVVTKPGYGIVADCLANRVAVLFTDRGPFREYDVLADALQSLGRARFVPREDVLHGRLAPHLEALRQLATPWTDQPMDGARVVAERVLAKLASGSNAIT